MDAFTSQTSRLHELMNEEFQAEYEGLLNELELTVPVATLLNNEHCTWTNLRALFDQNLVLWTDENAIMTNLDGHGHNVIAYMTVDFERDDPVTFEVKEETEREGQRHEPSTRIEVWSRRHDLVWSAVELMMTVLAQHEGTIISEISIFREALPLWVSLATFQDFITPTQSSRCISFDWINFNEAQCHALANDIHEDVHLCLSNCGFADGGAALVEALRNNRGPTKLSLSGTYQFGRDQFERSSQFIDAIGHNTSLRILNFERYTLSNTLFGDSQMRSFATILKTNHGLRELSLEATDISNDNWVLLMKSLCHHLTLESINLNHTYFGRARETHGERIARFLTRSNTMLDMMKENTVLRTIQVWDSEFNPEILQEIRRLLEVNRHRPLIQAVKSEIDGQRRLRLFGWALLVVRGKQPALTHMLWRENIDLMADWMSEENRLMRQNLRSEEERATLEEEITGTMMTGTMTRTMARIRQRIRELAEQQAMNNDRLRNLRRNR